MPADAGFVVIAGFGRFGQIAARILRARRIPFTALDISSEQVDFVRRFGNQIYYGDASRLEILEAANVGEARAFVLTVDDMAASLRAAAVMRHNFPHVPVFARARNREHVHRLRQLGVSAIQRETFGSALDLSQQLLVGLGMSESDAAKTVETFKAHDIKRLNEDFAFFDDPEKLKASAQSYAADLEALFHGDEAEARTREKTSGA
jgi:glutathione-regulated potassium-efflux system protein KefB